MNPARPRDSPDVGSVLSLALRLEKRKSGVSQAQIAKNVTTSPNAGGPRRVRCRWRGARHDVFNAFGGRSGRTRGSGRRRGGRRTR